MDQPVRNLGAGGTGKTLDLLEGLPNLTLVRKNDADQNGLFRPHGKRGPL